MALSQEKINIMRQRRWERLESGSLWPKPKAREFLKFFARKEKRLLRATLLLLLTQGLLEVALIIASHRYLRTSSFSFEAISRPALFILFFILASLYLFTSYAAIKNERTFVVYLINELRARWFKLFLFKRTEEHNLGDKSWLLAKLSYHLPLLSTGLDNSLIASIRWLLFMIILVFIAFIFSAKLLILAALALIVSLLIGWLGFFVSRRFVSREATFYSHIIRWVDLNLSDWKFVKNFQQERKVMKEFDNLVELDSYFRVRRNLWLRFSTSIIFILLIFFSFATGSWSNRVDYFFGSASLDSRFLMIVVLIYFSRLLYESVRAGLYSVPLFLGLKLAVPESKARKLGSNLELKFKKIVFQAQRIKLFKKGSYQKFFFNFIAGGRYLIIGKNRAGKSALARLFVGQANYGRRAWIIKKDNQRFVYNDFFHKFSNFYYLDPEFTSQRSILEVVCGLDKKFISSEDLELASNLVEQNSELKAVFYEREDWRFRADKFCVNAKNILVLQILHCLIKKPAIITVDNFWLDKNDLEINKLLSLLTKLLPNSLVIFFTTTDSDNNVVSYEEKYQI